MFELHCTQSKPRAQFYGPKGLAEAGTQVHRNESPKVFDDETAEEAPLSTRSVQSATAA